jgi:endonuclease-3
MRPRTTRTSAAPSARAGRAWEPAAVPPTGDPPADKKPFDIDEMVRRLRAAVAGYAPAAMFQLYDEGYRSVFEILVSCVISIRTLEEVTLPTSRRLFAAARTPRQVAAMTPAEIDRLIGACTFHEPKSRTIHAIAAQTVERHGGATATCRATSPP